MTTFQRARSADAKAMREEAILDAARELAERNGTRAVTLTSIADRIGLHKSALLRYFETREQIFLRLTASEWREWGPALVAALEGLGTAADVGAAVAHSLAPRHLFCDLLAQAPLNLERNVSVENVLVFKRVTLEQVDAISEALRRCLPGLTERDTIDIVAAATSTAGALLQMATPGDTLAEVYRAEPDLGHAIVDFEPTLVRIVVALVTGLVASRVTR